MLNSMTCVLYVPENTPPEKIQELEEAAQRQKFIWINTYLSREGSDHKYLEMFTVKIEKAGGNYDFSQESKNG